MMTDIQRVLFSHENQLFDMIQKIDKTEWIHFIKQHNLNGLKINNDGDTLLHVVAKYGNVEITKYLIQAGADVNAQNRLGKTPILLALEYKPCGYLQIIVILYQSNADIHIADIYGKSAVQLAFCDCNCIYDDIHKLFLAMIHYESKNKNQETAIKLISLQYPLYQAVLLRNPDVLRHMIMLGSSVNDNSSDTQMTALGRAVELMDVDIVKVLIECGADVDLCDIHDFHPIFHYGRSTTGRNQQPEIIKCILNASVLLKDLQENKIYQLKNAFQYGNKEVIQILLEYHHGILNIRDDQGQTPLHYLSANPHPDIAELLQDQNIDVNVKDKAGCTPLYMATISSYSHINNFKFLLQKGADVNIRTVFQSGLDLLLFSLCQNLAITKEKYFEIIDLFLQYGLDIQLVSSNTGTTVFDVILRTESFYMAEPLITHLAILQEQKKPILEHIFNKIDSHLTFKNYFDVCKVELTKLKDNIINRNLLLYEIVVEEMTEEQILTKCKFSPSSLLMLEKIKKEFYSNHYYYSIIQKCICPIVERLKLFEKAAPILCKISKCINDPYYIAIVEIIEYLNNQDLESLIKAEM